MPADDPPTFLPVAVPAPRAARSPITRIRRLFARVPLPVDANLPRPPGTGLYVDGENMPGGDPARRLITRILDDWPADRPPVRTLSVYVPADKTTLWEAWCTDRLPEALVRVRGVQRFRRETSKNSADLALAADAAVDFASGAVQLVAVLSSDSDFVSLYAKIAELAAARPAPPVHAPFLWITPSGGSPVSNEALDYFPDRLRWPVPLDTSDTSTAQEDAATGEEPTAEVVAATLLASFPDTKRSFKTSDVRPIVAKHWPDHPAADNPSVRGTYLFTEVLPGPREARRQDHPGQVSPDLRTPPMIRLPTTPPAQPQGAGPLHARCSASGKHSRRRVRACRRIEDPPSRARRSRSPRRSPSP